MEWVKIAPRSCLQLRAKQMRSIGWRGKTMREMISGGRYGI